jgi:tRNA threonylcarbamoyladenosine biosynthesis protein TsaE
MMIGELTVKSVAETRKFAKSIMRDIIVGSVVGLFGQLGSGKTTFVQGMAETIGVDQAVGSPTFKLISEYQTNSINLYHIDCYRLTNADDFLQIGGEEYLYPKDGITVIEWADIISSILPEGTLSITFNRISGKENHRTITISYI